MNNWDGIASLFIACLEAVLIINIIIFSEKSPAVKKGLIVLLLLLIYQAMEFIICGLKVKSSLAVYFAFADITLLPPAALFFILEIFNRLRKGLRLIFLPAIFFIIYYAFMVQEMKVTGCTVLYASYNYPLGFYYGIFYYSPIIIGVIILYFYRRIEENKKLRILSAVLLAGFLFTGIPVITAFILASAGKGYLLGIIESVLCKFAFSIALADGIFCLSYLKKK